MKGGKDSLGMTGKINLFLPNRLLTSLLVPKEVKKTSFYMIITFLGLCHRENRVFFTKKHKFSPIFDHFGYFFQVYSSRMSLMRLMY